jgi:hypothetical protein
MEANRHSQRECHTFVNILQNQLCPWPFGLGEPRGSAALYTRGSQGAGSVPTYKTEFERMDSPRPTPFEKLPELDKLLTIDSHAAITIQAIDSALR